MKCLVFSSQFHLETLATLVDSSPPFRQKLQRRFIMQYWKRSNCNVVLTPSFNNHHGMSTALDPIHCLTFDTKTTFEAFVGTFCPRLDGFNQKIAQPFISSPLQQSQTHKLWTPIAFSTKGQPRLSNNFSSTSVSCWLRLEPATSINRLYLISSSTTVKNFNYWPLAKPSNTKSNAQTLFGDWPQTVGALKLTYQISRHLQTC